MSNKNKLYLLFLIITIVNYNLDKLIIGEKFAIIDCIVVIIFNIYIIENYSDIIINFFKKIFENN